MKRLSVCKTVVSYPERTRFLLFSEHSTSDPIRWFLTLKDLAEAARPTPTSPVDDAARFIKNEAPGDIIWRPDDLRSDMVLECERLSRDEVHELAQSLRR